MSFSKVVLTGTRDKIKAAFERFNTFIDDLVAITSGKGASQVGILDTAGNMAAANVEDALAEIYTDTLGTRTLSEIFNVNADTTTGLTWGYQAGTLRRNNVIVSVSAGTVSLADDTTNYIEIDNVGTMSRNTTGFTSGRIPIRQIVTASGVQTTSTDKRGWFQFGGKSLTIVTSDRAITAAELVGDLTITNTGAGAAIALTLPAGASGYSCEFEVTAAQYLKVTAAGTETFGFYSSVGAAGGYIRSNVIGTRWRITWSGGRWTIHDLTGTLNYDE